MALVSLSPQVSPQSVSRSSFGISVEDVTLVLRAVSDAVKGFERAEGLSEVDWGWRGRDRVLVFIIEALSEGVEDGGTELDRRIVWAAVVASCVEVCICPLAEVSLFVKEEIAQPAQDEESDCAFPMRGAVEVAVPEGGCTVSGSVWMYLRIRCM